jgi:hypothetical protein
LRAQLGEQFSAVADGPDRAHQIVAEPGGEQLKDTQIDGVCHVPAVASFPDRAMQYQGSVAVF